MSATSLLRAIDAVSVDSSDRRLQELVEWFVRRPPTEQEIAHLTRRLAESGSTLVGRAGAIDIASTGGPSSLSTVLCPLQLRALGFIVPKLAVPGRPAGGVDVLATIPGYHVDLDVEQVEAGLAAAGYVHFLAGQTWAPLDARLFRLRQVIDAQVHPPLVIASLLAKKVAVGLTTAGLEVRVAPHGNFGADISTARENATRFVRVAELLGIEATCVLTDASTPYQPFFGRGESLLALDLLFEGGAPPALTAHGEQCRIIAATVARAEETSVPSEEQLRDYFAANLEAQGSSAAAFESRVRQIRAAPRRHVLAPRTGYPRWELERLRTTLVGLHVRFAASGRFPDPGGLVLRPDGGAVERGAVVAEARGETEAVADQLAAAAAQAVTIEDEPRRAPPTVLEVIRG